MDKAITLQISNMIQEYEERTENKIDKISIYQDASKQYVYPNLKDSGDMKISTYAADWCISRILKLYTGRELEVIESEESKKEEFLQKNWDYFSKEQIIFEDNVMHLCVF